MIANEIDSIWFYIVGNGKLWIILLCNNPCMCMKTIMLQQIKVIFPAFSKMLMNVIYFVILFLSSKHFPIRLGH